MNRNFQIVHKRHIHKKNILKRPSVPSVNTHRMTASKTTGVAGAGAGAGVGVRHHSKKPLHFKSLF